VRLPAASPQITIIAWVDGSAISLPGGANSYLVNALTVVPHPASFGWPNGQPALPRTSAARLTRITPTPGW
jgi:hypothetical protein